MNRHSWVSFLSLLLLLNQACIALAQDYHSYESQSCNNCCSGFNIGGLCIPGLRVPDCLSDADIGGWLAFGTTINTDENRSSTGNAPLGFNNFANGTVLNQAWLYAEKAAENNGCGAAWGYRIDGVFGADGPDNQAFGDGTWDESLDTGGEYGIAIPQFYAELAWDNVTTRFGRFYTILGYEVSQAPENFFYSHSYTFYYNEPFTHTGILSQYNATEDITVYGGWTLGWDSGFRNRNEGSTFLGGVSLTLTPDIRFNYTTIFGDPGDSRTATSSSYMHTMLLNAQLTNRLNYVAQHDFQTRSTGGGPDTLSYGLNQYLLYTLNDCWSIGTRLEIFRDEDGARVGNGAGTYYEWTNGIVFRPMPNLMLRSELRWDGFDGTGRPYDDNTNRHLFTFGNSVVFTF